MTAAEIVHAKEDLLRPLRNVETAFVIDEHGNIILEKTSETNYEIEFTDQEIAMIRAAANAIFTHNHPRGWNYSPEDARYAGSSFSPNDIELACKVGLAEIRAVTPKYRFSMTPAEGIFLESDWQAISLVYATENAEVKQEFGTAVMQGRMSREAYAADLLHETWIRVAGILGLQYNRVEE